MILQYSIISQEEPFQPLQVDIDIDGINQDIAALGNTNKIFYMIFTKYNDITEVPQITE